MANTEDQDSQSATAETKNGDGKSRQSRIQWWQLVIVPIIVALIAILPEILKELRTPAPANNKLTPSAAEAVIIFAASASSTPIESAAPSATPLPPATLIPTPQETSTPTPTPQPMAPGQDFLQGCISAALWASFGTQRNLKDGCLDIKDWGFAADIGSLSFLHALPTPRAPEIAGIYTLDEIGTDATIDFDLQINSVTTVGAIDAITMFGIVPANPSLNDADLSLEAGSFLYIFKGGANAFIKAAKKEPDKIYQLWPDFPLGDISPGSYHIQMSIQIDSQGEKVLALYIGSSRQTLSLDLAAANQPVFFIGYSLRGGTGADLAISNLCIHSPSTAVEESCSWAAKDE